MKQQIHVVRVEPFTKKYKRAVQLTKKNTKVAVNWDSGYLDLEGLRKWFICRLHYKINTKGGIRQDYRDSRTDLLRDREIYTTWIQKRQKTQWGLKFYTKYFRKRFPEVEVQMKERFTH